MTGRSPQLRPVGVSDFADNAFRLYRRNFWLFVGLIAVTQVPMALVEAVYETFLSPAERIQAVAAALVVIVYPFCSVGAALAARCRRSSQRTAALQWSTFGPWLTVLGGAESARRFCGITMIG